MLRACVPQLRRLAHPWRHAIGLTSGANWDSGLSKAMGIISDASRRDFFAKRSYGESVYEVFVVFMCRDAELEFKKRVRI